MEGVGSLCAWAPDQPWVGPPVGVWLWEEASFFMGRRAACPVGLVAGGNQVTSCCVARGPGGGRSSSQGKST